jgi:hypothetical protein
MASLSNINGLFDVHSTGAILFSDEHGTTGQILRSNGNAAPTWIDFNSTGFGGDYVPIAGNVTITGAIATDTGISLTVGGALIVSGRATFPSAVANRPQLPGGFLGLNTGDGNFDIWGISTQYYPSHATAANAWGLQWNGDTNQFRFVGGGSDVVTIDLDQGNFVTTGNITGTTATFSGLVSGIAPTADLNFATKKYVDDGRPDPGVTQITAGTNVTITPVGGTGNVTINANTQGDITGLTAGTGITIAAATGPVPTITNSAPNIVQTSVTGNAGTATALQTARTINAVSFNGTANIMVPSIYDGNYRRITNPGGAEYVTTTSSVTGTIEIIMPITSWTGMFSFTVEVYEYITNRSFTLKVGGHLSSTTWYNEFAYLVGNPGTNLAYTIRFGRNAAGKAVVYIGELAETWSYPQAWVTDICWGYSGGGLTLTTGWDINFRTAAFEGVTRTQTAVQVGYQQTSNIANSVVLRDGSGGFSAGAISGTTFNGLAINTTGTNNVANQIVRTQVNGYVNFGWINSISGNHTGTITRITASGDAYLRYVTPAQFRVGVTDGYYAPTGTVSGVTSVATGNGLTGGTITSTGTLSMSGSYSGTLTATTFSGPLSGNASTSTTFNTGRTNYYNVTNNAVIGQMMWKNYGNNHTIFDASQSTSPSGSSVNNTNSNTAWTASYPTLMGWNGSGTYGVRVDSARIADSAANQGNYLPLAGGIMSGNVGRSAHNVGFQVGGYNNIGDNATASNPIYAIGTSYMPAVTTLSNMYGIGYCYPSASFIGLTGASGWGMYVASDGDARIWLDGGTGTVSTAGAMYAGIYYDYNNTAYYVNPSDATSARLFGFVKIGNSSTYNTDDGNWGTRLVVASTIHARIDVAQDADSMRSSWWCHTGGGGSVFGTVTGHDQFLYSHNAKRQTLFSGFSQEEGSFRAPIFYDSNNTGYYADLAGQSILYNLELIGAKHTYLTINPGNPYEAMVRYTGGSGTHWYVGKRNGTSNGITSADFHWYSAAAGVTVGGITTAGVMQVTGSSRAPIFYDSNNTGYYGDFASTSRTNIIDGNVFSGNIATSGNGQNNYPFRLGSDYNSYMVAAASNTWGLFWAGNVGAKYGTNGTGGPGNIWGNSGNPNEFVFVGADSTKWALYGNDGRSWQAGYATNAASMRAPIFYDSANTGYYGDFASTSVLNGLNLAGQINAVNGNGRIILSGNFHLDAFNGNDFYVSYYSNRRFRVWAGSSFESFRVDTDQIVYAFNQLRTPIVYDYNNTAYYLDPASTGTSLNVAGDVVAYSSSDIRYKDNVKPIENALDKIDKIKGYTFEWNELSHKQTGKKDIGVIAQEVEEILPEIIDTRSNGYKAVDYPKLTALLIQSVKEQQIIINDLKSRIEKLEL